MTCRFTLFTAAAGVFLFCSTAPSDEPLHRSTAATIDNHVIGQLQAVRLKPSPRSTDSEFLRRVWLDIAGRIPPASVARQFPANTDPDRRERLIGDLLEHSGYVRHFTTFWGNVLIPEVKSNEDVQRLLPGFDAWLREHLARNTPYDQMVREIITTPLKSAAAEMQMRRQGAEQSPIAFFQAKEIAPENLAAATSRIFLGIRIECAQCHDHPFDDWSQKQFWSYASFFAGIERQGNNGIFGQVEEVFDRREMLIPDTDIVVQAGYLDGTTPQWKFRTGSRRILADWIVSKDNPYFARMAVNRLWGKFFGVGLVDPVDDFTSFNPCSHPELLDSLAEQFIQSGFDLKFLIKAMTTSRSYQFSGVRTPESPTGPQQFALMPVRGLTPEQLYDSIAEATGLFEPFRVPSPGDSRRMTQRDEILELFANDTDPTTEQQTSILQALALMNGQLTASAVDLKQSRTLAAIAEFPMSTEERVASLFYASVSRPPDSGEKEKFVSWVKSGGATGDSSQALADVFWALLNSTEFATNH